MSDEGYDDTVENMLHPVKWLREDLLAECGTRHLVPGQIQVGQDHDGDYVLAVSLLDGHTINIFYAKRAVQINEAGYAWVIAHPLHYAFVSPECDVFAKRVPKSFRFAQDACEQLDLFYLQQVKSRLRLTELEQDFIAAQPVEPFGWIEPLIVESNDTFSYKRYVCRICSKRWGVMGGLTRASMTHESHLDHMMIEHCESLDATG